MKLPSFLKQNNIIALIILNIIVFGGYAFAFFSMKAIQENMSLLQNEVETSVKKNDTLHSIEAILRDSNSDIEKLQSYFIAPGGIVAFIETIEAQAEVSGVETVIDYVNVEGDGQSKVVGGKEIVRLRLSTKGSWENSTHFLSLLEKVPFQINLERVSFIYSPESESSLSFAPPKGTKLPVKKSWKGSIDLTSLKLK
ncbi:MAG: hypothetical protein AAB706_00060 [Patescibacteria group bacterium]